MTINPCRRLLIVAFLLVFSLMPLGVYGQNSYSVPYTELLVCSDGVVEVRQVISVNEREVSISLILLSSSVQNVLVLDQDDVPLSYEIAFNDMRITTLGASKVTLGYLTSDLTVKKGNVWTLRIDTPYSASIILPDQSNLIYVSDLPLSMGSKNNGDVLVVSPGLWEISYIQPSIISPIAATKPPSAYEDRPVIAALGVVTVAIAGIIGIFLFLKKRGS